jgi:hypothetical protein
MAVSTNKSHPENSVEGQQAKARAQASDPTLGEVQQQADQETELGFRGIEADPTPNENYSVAGVTSGKPTPETDKAQAQKVKQYQTEVQAKVDGVAGNGN